MRLLAIAVAAAAALGSGLAGPAPATATAQPPQIVFTSPLPLDPAAPQELPTTDQVTRILTQLTDPAVSDKARNNLVQGGTGSGERRAFARDRLDRAARHGELPLSFGVGNIWPVGPNTAAAQVTVGGPKRAPVTEVLTFIDQGDWRLSSDSAATLIQAVARD